MSTTEAVLKDWRYGTVAAERLTAAILHIEGYEDVDPQHPLGGPDGLKDVKCQRRQKLFIAAAFFPPRTKRFADIQEKFIGDLAGVAKNNAHGFVFIVNQYLTIKQREYLLKESGSVTTEIYHLERVVSVLDSPKGYGVRFEYLRIAMTESEQLSYWNSVQESFDRSLSRERGFQSSRFDKIDQTLNLLLNQTQQVSADVQSLPSMIAAEMRLSIPPTATLSIPLLCWIHRLVTKDDARSSTIGGELRRVEVWIGPDSATPETASHTPPPAREVETELQRILSKWRDGYASLKGQPKRVVAEGLARLHHGLLWVHPFLDSNGRVARLVTQQACRELTGLTVSSRLTESPSDYYKALSLADNGNFNAIIDMIVASME